MSGSLTLITPAHRRDIDRFVLQRESIARCGITIPHVAIVNHEDLPLFRDQPLGVGLTLVSTRDVLPKKIERRRLACQYRRRHPLRWIYGKPLHGWGVQQFLKLAAPDIIQTSAFVCMDSDTLFIGKIGADDFFDPVTGRPFLYETFDDVDVEMSEWVARSMRFLGVKSTHQPVSRFTHSPVVMCRDVVLDMRAFIEKRHGGHWMTAMDRFGMIMEYSTYGVYAKHVDGLARVTPGTPRHSLYFWWAEEVAQLTRTLSARARDSGAKILAVQSNVGKDVAEYRQGLNELWAVAC